MVLTLLFRLLSGSSEWLWGSDAVLNNLFCQGSHPPDVEILAKQEFIGFFLLKWVIVGDIWATRSPRSMGTTTWLSRNFHHPFKVLVPSSHCSPWTSSAIYNGFSSEPGNCGEHLTVSLIVAQLLLRFPFLVFFAMDSSDFIRVPNCFSELKNILRVFDFFYPLPWAVGSSIIGCHLNPLEELSLVVLA